MSTILPHIILATESEKNRPDSQKMKGNGYRGLKVDTRLLGHNCLKETNEPGDQDKRSVFSGNLCPS